MVRNIEPDTKLIQVTSPQQLNAQTLSLLERLIDDAISRKPAGLTLNLAPVQSLDSAGLNWLLGLQKRLAAQGMHLELLNPNALLQDVFVATRLDSRLAIKLTVAEGEVRHG